MEINYPAGTRSFWHDRNATTITTSITAALVAPHAATVRASYTVPASRRLVFGNISNSVIRDGVATTAGMVAAWINLAGVETVVLTHLSNVLGASNRADVGAGTIIQAGTVVQSVTADPSTLGTMRYDMQWAGNEYDA